MKRHVSKNVHIYKRSENRYSDIILISNHKSDLWITIIAYQYQNYNSLNI